MEILGYLASAIIGISLGLIGGGGSILTVPVLVYLLHVDTVLATAYSLFIVGTTSLVGVIPKYRQGLVSIKTAVIFGIPSIAAVFATRKFLVPAIPDTLFYIGELAITKAIFIMVLFAILMVFASITMIREKKVKDDNGNLVKPTDEVTPIHYNYPMIILEGLVVGVLTGLVGAGGGFLIIPALVLFTKLPMKMAVGTSLLIIAAKSLIGFTGDLGHYSIDWTMLMTVTAIAVVGIFIGSALSKKIDGVKLKKSFGWFVLVMGIYILIKEIFFA